MGSSISSEKKQKTVRGRAYGWFLTASNLAHSPFSWEYTDTITLSSGSFFVFALIPRTTWCVDSLSRVIAVLVFHQMKGDSFGTCPTLTWAIWTQYSGLFSKCSQHALLLWSQKHILLSSSLCGLLFRPHQGRWLQGKVWDYELWQVSNICRKFLPLKAPTIYPTLSLQKVWQVPFVTFKVAEGRSQPSCPIVSTLAQSLFSEEYKDTITSSSHLGFPCTLKAEIAKWLESLMRATILFGASCLLGGGQRHFPLTYWQSFANCWGLWEHRPTIFTLWDQNSCILAFLF